MIIREGRCIFDIRSAKYYDFHVTNTQGDSILAGGYEHCGPEFYVERSGFPYHVMEYIEEGEGHLTLRGKSYPLYAGILFSFGPHIPHVIQVTPRMPLIKHYVVFSGKTLIRQVRQLGISSTPLHTSHPVRLCDMFSSLLQTGVHESKHRREICLLQLKQIVLSIDERGVSQREFHSRAWQTYMRARYYAEKSFLNIKNLEQLAHDCHIEKAYLCRLFRRYSDETPMQLLVRLKMRRAADLMLTDPTCLIKQIADSIGYPDPYHFSRVFKSFFKICPENYIATFRGGGSNATKR